MSKATWKRCNRCKGTGHNDFECLRFKNNSKELIKSSEKERKENTGSMIPREETKSKLIPYFGAKMFHELSDEEIRKLDYNVSGIYEIAVDTGKKLVAVYLGTSSNLRERIRDHYTEHGRVEDGEIRISNICSHVKDARKKGYTLYFRTFQTENPKEAKKAESHILSNYDYAWNIDENGKKKRFVVF